MYSLKWKEGKETHIACTSKLDAAIGMFESLKKENKTSYIRLYDLETETVVRAAVGTNKQEL